MNTVEEYTEAAIQAFEGRDSLASSDFIDALLDMTGSRSAASHAITALWKGKVVRRRKRRKKHGYEYRLTSKFPTWGASYDEERRAKKTARHKRIEACKKNWMYRLDQLLKPVRERYAS